MIKRREDTETKMKSGKRRCFSPKKKCGKTPKDLGAKRDKGGGGGGGGSYQKKKRVTLASIRKLRE